MEERTANLEMWRELGLDIKAHCDLLDLLREVYPAIYMSQENRPPGMAYFDAAIAEIHGDRIRELLEHKASGGKVVGTFCVYVPDELIYAAGAIPVGLCGGASVGADRVDALLPRNLCPLIKSIVGFKESKLCPYFASCDILVGETTCDGKKKTWEIIAEDTPMHVMELPHRKSESGRATWLNEVAALRAKLEELTGNKITRESLSEGIRLANGKRRALARLYETRKTNPPPISGRDALLVSQVAFYDDAARFTHAVNTLVDQCEAISSPRMPGEASHPGSGYGHIASPPRGRGGSGGGVPGAPRLLVSGCPMAVPNWKLHHVVETSGASIVCEETCTGTRYFENYTEDPGSSIDAQLAAIADRYLKTNCACFTPNDGRIEQIKDLVREYKADGVIYYTLQFCHTYNVEGMRVEKALEAAGIPVLRIETDYGMEDAGQIRTRVEAFMERIG